MISLKNMMEDMALKPAFDKATEMGAVDLYSKEGCSKFFKGKRKIGFISELLFNGETVKDKQARLIIYDKQF